MSAILFAAGPITAEVRGAKGLTYLYQKVGRVGEHLKVRYHEQSRYSLYYVKNLRAGGCEFLSAS